MLALEFSGLNLSFQGLKFVWWCGMAPVKEMAKKGISSGTTSIGLWIAYEMDINCAFLEI